MVPTSISLVDLDDVTFGEQIQDGGLLAHDLIPEVVVHTGDMVVEGTVDNGTLLVKASIEFLAFIDKLQAKVLQAALEHRKEWFDYKHNVSESGVKTMFRSYRTDDVIRLRVVNTVFYDEDKNVVDETAITDKQSAWCRQVHPRLLRKEQFRSDSVGRSDQSDVQTEGESRRSATGVFGGRFRR